MTEPHAHSYRTVEVSRIEDDRVLRVVLAQPKANVLTSEMLDELHRALLASREDPRLRMVLLRGAGASFSYGASVEEHRRDEVRRMLGRFHDVVRAVASFPVPVAAAVEGRCLGGAFELVLAAHFVFAKVDAIFACPEIKLGVFPPVLAALGPKRMPGAVAERLLLTGEEIDASIASAFGLVTGVVPRDGDAEQATLEWYRRHLAGLSAFALRQATAAAREGGGVPRALDETLRAVERRYFEHVVPSHDGNEGLEAFLAKRAPAWRDA